MIKCESFILEPGLPLELVSMLSLPMPMVGHTDVTIPL